MTEAIKLATRQVLAAMVLAVFVVTSTSLAHAAGEAKAMLVLDASGSMWQKVRGVHKITIARQVVSGLMEDWDREVQLGLTAYGHRRKGDCSDIQTIIPISDSTAERVPGVVNKLSPKGKTPISAAITKAARELRYTEEPATVILVTDGIETCNADPCSVAKTLEESGVDFTAHVIGFDLSEEEGAQVRCIADFTGGQFHAANTADQLLAALRSAAEAAKPKLSDKVRIALSEGGPLLDDGDAHFEFFASDGSGKAEGGRLADNYGHIGFARVEPGDYVASVKYGYVQTSKPIAVGDEGSEHVVVLNAGILRLTPLLGAKTLSLSFPLMWSVQKVDDAGSNAKVIGRKLDTGQGTVLVLHPGRYFITGQLSGVKKQLDITIEAGEHIDVEADMRSGTINLRALLSDSGEPAIAKPYFVWEAYTADSKGMPAGKPLIKSLQSGAKFVLPIGKNIIVFKDKLVTRQIQVMIEEDQNVNQDLVINAGTVRFEIVDSGGNRVRGYPNVEFYPSGVEHSSQNRLGNVIAATGELYVPDEPIDIVVRIKQEKTVFSLNLEPGEARSLKLQIGG